MITRREFVRYAGLGALALALPPMPFELACRDEYVSDTYGFRLRKPLDWRWVSTSEVEQSRNEARLPAGEDAKRTVTRLAGLPLLVATKLPDPERGPTLVLWRQPASAGHHAATDNEGFSLVHQRTYQLYAPYLRDYRLDSALADVFGGRPASCCKIRFGEDNDRGEAWSVRLESHMLRWQDSWLTFNFLDLQEGWGQAARADFATLERSLEFFSV